uniref:Uncharacterized protein n=1 Tax=Cucumis melo TaxID=3656 RepID=A0A9I9EBI3_CUCME
MKREGVRPREACIVTIHHLLPQETLTPQTLEIKSRRRRRHSPPSVVSRRLTHRLSLFDSHHETPSTAMSPASVGAASSSVVHPICTSRLPDLRKQSAELRSASDMSHACKPPKLSALPESIRPPKFFELWNFTQSKINWIRPQLWAKIET